MELDAWRDEEVGSPRGTGALAFAREALRFEASAFQQGTEADPLGPECRSECWEALLVQIRAAAASNAFSFTDRPLDGVGAIELTHYLRDKCTAKFVDLSRLGRWADISLAAASALRHALRSTRSLALDGNNLVASPDAFEAWCQAVEEHPGLQRLSLRDVGLHDRAATRLAATLRGHSVLFSVDLSRNRIGDEGVEALTGALTENLVLLELDIEGTDASEGARRALEAVLDRNRARFGGRAGCARALQGLRLARAEAEAAQAMGAARTPAVAGPLTRRGELAPVFDASLRHLSTAVEVHPGALVWPPLVPTVEQALAAEAASEADGVFFDASEGVTLELRMRCEAGWRYAAPDAEVLQGLLRTIGDLKAQRRQDRDRTEETLARVAEAQRQFRLRASPVEAEIAGLKERLAVEIEATNEILQERIRCNLLLKAAEEELEQALLESHHAAVNAQKQENGLKMQHREVDEEAADMQAGLLVAEEELERMERENELCRRRLHAARFETETERFYVPARAVLAAVAD